MLLFLIACASLYAAGTGTYQFTTSNTASNQYRIRIESATNPSLFAYSAQFELSPAGSVNQCSVNNNGCDSVVVCTYSGGVSTCGPCPQGYTGTSQACTDINECATGNGGCSTTPLVTCSNTVGSRNCGTCPSGYTGNGVTCTGQSSLPLTTTASAKQVTDSTRFPCVITTRY